jgi:undecaprenyl-phosphate galactose phosphotransferase
VADQVVLGDRAALEGRLEDAVRAGACRYILIAFDEHELGAAMAVARLVDDKLRIPYGIIPALNDISKSSLQLYKFFGHDMVVLHNSRAPLGRRKLGYKRLFDAVGAAALLLVLSPLTLSLAVLVRQDGGPAFYGSPRIGRDGRVFRALKFRSMVPDADGALRELLASDAALRAEWERGFKLKRDPRVTLVGRFLRATSLDELPQLINVLRGEMSLVGPRPLLLAERDQYTGRSFELYQKVTPGLTGMWQVSGRDDLEYYRRIELNNWYIKNWSPWIDVVILVKTVFVVLRRAGAS